MNKRYKTFENQTLFVVGDYKLPKKDFLFLKNLIEDRKSKFSGTFYKVTSVDEVKRIIKKIKQDKFYKKATHNIYAYRILTNDGIVEWKNDDGEIGGGNCILSILRNKNIVNTLVIVTRYYWWIHLNADRFKHIVNVAKKVVEEIWQ